MKFIKIDRLICIEKFGPKKVKKLKNKILKDGVWIRPICIDKKRFLIMDGHHRFEVAKQLGFKYIPCKLYSYSEVEVRSMRKNHTITKELIIKKVLSGDVYPYKTVKHKFPGGYPCSDVPIEVLLELS